MAYDVIVVGARCAGSPTAMLLARRGHRVLLVDRATFPSDTMSTHFIHQLGASRLRAWGLLDRVAATGCPPSSTFQLDAGPLVLRGAPRAADGTRQAYAPRRRLLDQLLLDAALEAGAQLWDDVVVEDLLRDGDRVAGVRGRTRDGRTVSEQARVVVGADGVRSRVARLVDAPAYTDRGTLACTYYTYWSGVPTEDLQVYLRDRCSFGVFGTNDGLTCIPVSWQRERFDEVRTDVEGHYLAALEQAPEVAERVRSGTREERFVGTGYLPNHFRVSAGPGWALVGDAAHHKDPSTARGISDAFVHAELLVEALDAGLTGRRDLDEALREYQRRRDADAMPFFDLNCELSALEPPTPQMQQLLGALVGNQPEIDRFVGLIAGTERVESFFAPEHLDSVLASAGAEPALTS